MLKRLPLPLAALVLSIAAGNFIVRDFLAKSLVAYGEDPASRDLAVTCSPGDPAVVAARAKYLLYRADPPRQDEGLAGLRLAAQLSPRDYRFWLELGRGYESAGMMEPAGRALRRAADLSPGYFESAWALANFHLRAGDRQSAAAELRRAIELSGRDGRPDERAALNAFSAATGESGPDLELLDRIAPGDEVSRAYLAGFLASRRSLEEALGIWRSLSGSDRKSYLGVSFRIVGEAQGAGLFADASSVWDRIVDMEGLPGREAGNSVFNPGFEARPLAETYPQAAENPPGFDWNIGRHPEVRIRRSVEERHAGAYSLWLLFPAAMSRELGDVSILVPVGPSRSYEISWFVKARNISLVPDEAPFVEATDALHPERLSVRTRIPTGAPDWVRQTVAFTSSPDTRGLRITIRSPRLLTVDRTRVPELWFDDFRVGEISK